MPSQDTLTSIAGGITLGEQLLGLALQVYAKEKADAGMTDEEADAHYDQVSADTKAKIAAARALIAADNS